ncbi:lipopolysaccharide biosynthesis protein [Coprobacter tertius]|uniref:Lipopolysaccharide biosynthesis protein n=1 Tax=Coprobacter tertius TaxID=2944915 RepID=A0ABT1ME21_9BACT|nr:lipopolysaccharide biosynthesis protein [Coprobacter tertius]MCP9610604.1 lipopolysaccharide biosynthesis protein [Coprobacter tertius]
MSESLKEKTAKGLFWGGLSNGLQQILNLLFGIFIARILNAGDYGMVGMLMIFSAIAGIIQDSGFSIALINKRNATHKDYNAVFWFCALVGISMYLILFFIAPLIARFYGIPQLVPLSRFLFLGFLIGSLGTVHGAILTKKMMIKQKAKANIIAILFSGTVGVIMALNGMSYWGIAAQNITYMLTLVILIWHYSPWKPTLKINLNPLKGMFSFSFKVLITNIFVQANANIFSALLGKFYNPSQVGFYTQGNKWMVMGNTFIASMVNGVSQPVLAEVSAEKDRQLKIFRKMLRFTAFVSFPIMFGLALIAPELILITVTDKWLPSVPILQLLCIWGAVSPLNTLFSNMIVSHGRSNIFMWNTITLGILQFGILLLLHRFGIYAMIIGFATVNICWIFIWQRFARRFIGLRLIDMLKDILPYAFFALLSIGISYSIVIKIDNIYASVIIKFICAVILYLFFMWISRSVMFRESISFIYKKRRKI